MAGVIILADVLVATNADILQGTRLQSIPSFGILTFEMQASDSDATNFYTATIQMPSGDTPLNGTRIPCGNSTGLAGVIDERTNLTASFIITQGGHCVFSVTEVGDAEFAFRVTFTPTG